MNLWNDITAMVTKGNPLENALSFSTGGILGGSGGVINWGDGSGVGPLGATTTNSLQGGWNNRTLKTSAMAIASYYLAGKLVGGGEAGAPADAPLTEMGSSASGTTPAAPIAQDAFTSASPNYSLASASNAPPGIGLNAPSQGLMSSTPTQTIPPIDNPGVWNKVGSFLGTTGGAMAAGMAIQGAGAIMSGMGAAEQNKIAKERQDYERAKYERGLVNINAPIQLPFNVKPYKTGKTGIINGGVA